MPEIDVFWEIHNGLPREGPGDRASVSRALDLTLPLPPAPVVLDIACGPGGQTLDLAELLPAARIFALDNHRPFLEDLSRRTAARGRLDQITAIDADMRALPFAPQSFDLIWCEGAAYFIGLDAALRQWKPLLKRGGRLALSEPVWLRPNPPEFLRSFWGEYPQMGEIAAARSTALDCGYRLLGDFVLPPAAWWDNYYTPIEAKLPGLRERHAHDPVALAEIAKTQEEIDYYRLYADSYGYLFIVLSA